MDRMMQFFAYEHLPKHLQKISRPFGELAKWIVETLPSNPEGTVALRKLLEAKDCAVRALLYVEPGSNTNDKAGPPSLRSGPSSDPKSSA